MSTLIRECAPHPDPKTRMIGLSLLSDRGALPFLAPLVFNLRSCALILLLFGSSRKVRRVINKRSWHKISIYLELEVAMMSSCRNMHTVFANYPRSIESTVTLTHPNCVHGLVH